MYSKEEIRALKRDFWTDFSRYCDFDPVLSRRRTKFMLYNTRVKGIEMKWVVEPGRVEVVMELNHPNADMFIEQWIQMESCKPIFSRILGEDSGLWIWDDDYELADTGKHVGRIYLTCEGLNYHRRSDWPAIFKFMGHNMHRLERVWVEVKPLFEE